MTEFPQLDGFRGAPGVVRLIGHRGARGVMPENTMEGFAFTLKIGVRAMEFDVVMTRDRIPVITHNHHLLNAATRDAEGNWLTGPEPKVSKLTLAELRQFDVGGLDGRTVYGRRFPDQAFMTGLRIPRLADLLEFARRPEGSGLLLLLEMKSEPAAPGAKGDRLSIVHEVVREVRDAGLQERTILHSFDWSVLEECARVAPEMPRSYLSQLPENTDDPGEDSQKSVAPDFDALGVSIPRAVARAGGRMWCPYFKDVTADLVAEAHGLGLLVAAWTANEPEDIEAMIDAGVDGIITDYPGRAQRILLSRGLRW
ncbi:putative glycerophosphoryl diester phosphodiesterase 1 [Pseudoruegeria aquimaris]|uniref:Putative glycerophosphoryl diester phosphodiesterase 1 n=1 Tax=Pseudoruegeria aquimaris TaxID=393663 RepID=A0A1Y5SW63_9RHOB|nr:glycerophosphodiester phosphodiesterase [Pseudoruegeria aquimaris]SLN46542.1 putative glycerophosphoryl diester phosphodiesterase 1 [Pseudoruegeria aquimaris]